MIDRIITQREADRLTGTERSTRRRMGKKGLFPLHFQLTPNGSTGYLESEIAAWIAARAANRSPTTKVAAANAAKRQKQQPRKEQLSTTSPQTPFPDI
jgi:predicted DNA-binding transcriptional regulator AlpA